jgi:two-component system, LytTR family, sensor kinase
MKEDTGWPRVPLRLILLSIASLWTCYFVVATLRALAVGMDMSGEVFFARLLIVIISMAVFAALIPLVRLLDHARAWVQLGLVLVGALPVALLLAAINNVVFDTLHEHDEAAAAKTVVRIIKDDTRIATKGVRVDILEDDTAVLQDKDVTIVLPEAKIENAAEAGHVFKGLVEIGFGRYFLVLAWAALYFALVKGEQARLAERREGEYRRAAAQAELRSLRYQVNPHFLFNTLNSLSALVMTRRPERAEEMIQTLSTYYRRTLASDPTADATLGEEVALQQLYLEIEAVRFPDRLRSRIDLPVELADALVPGMILQPLVENSVKYAVSVSQQPVTVTISASMVAGLLELRVGDDGPAGGLGSDSGSNSGSGFGIGLANVRDRLHARFGEAASLAFGPRAGGGFETVMSLPLQRKAGPEAR